MRRLPLVFLPLTFLLAGCTGSVGGGYDRVVGGTDAWGVSVADPEVDSLGECHNDPSVETAALSMDLPSSAYGLRLVPGSSETDALRLADCLVDAHTSDKITITSPDE
jgi:hypothetical protein